MSGQGFFGLNGITEGFLRNLEQVFIQGRTLFFPFGVLDADHPLLSTAPMVSEDDLDPNSSRAVVNKRQ